MSQARTQVAIPGPLGRRRRRWRPSWVRSGSVLGGPCADLVRRVVDVVLAGLGLAALAPLLIGRGLRARWRAGAAFARTPLVGRFRIPFDRLDFADDGWGRSLPVLFNVLRGDLAFAGPRALTVTEAEAVPPQAWSRFAVRPGLVSPHAVRRRVGVAYEDEGTHDREFVYTETWRGNLGLVARSLPGMVLGGGTERPAPPRLDFFGVPVVNTTMDEALDWIVERGAGASPAQLAFVNPDCLNIAYGNEAYRRTLCAAARVLPDGIGLQIGCRLLGTSLVANVNGTDLFPRLCERLAGTELSLYLLGARPGVADAVAANMTERYPGLRIAGTRHGYFGPEEGEGVIEAINRSGAQILLVAFGAPRQELWIAGATERLRPRVCMGVGGLFDFYSGRVPRAPVWIREIGFEWVWRLWQEPGRMWRRYIVGNPLFLYRVWQQARDGRRRAVSAPGKQEEATS